MLTIFPHPEGWVYTTASTNVKEEYVCHVLLMQWPDLIQHNRALIAILERLQSVVDRPDAL